MPFLFWWISLNLRQRGSQILSNNPGPKMLLKCSMRTCDLCNSTFFCLNNKSDHNAISITSVHDPWFHRFGPNKIWIYRLSPQLFGGRGRRSGHTNQRLTLNQMEYMHHDPNRHPETIRYLGHFRAGWWESPSSWKGVMIVFLVSRQESSPRFHKHWQIWFLIGTLSKTH